MAPGKRKRNERASVDAGENRPSLHRPQNTNLGQHDRGQDMRDGGRRSSRGGQGGVGGRGGRRNDSRDNPNKLNINAAARSTPGPMSPPPRPSSATQTPTPTAELPSPVPKADPAPFDYSFLTDDRIASWDSTSRQEVVQLGAQARQDEDPMDLASVFQELIRATLDGRLDPTDAGTCVKEILGPDTTTAEDTSAIFDPSTFFLDTLSMIFEADHPPNTPTNPSLRPFIAATGISPMIMRQMLDGRLLQDTGLTRDTFNRVGVRQATNLLYRQANYNLLREETEGYSKLVTELFTTSGSEPPSAEVVEDAFERVKGLIGTFDLDVGRVLDITLDVFAAVLIKHYRFFIKLLRVSSWWPRIGEGDLVAASGGLPNWALPSSPGWMPTEEEEELSRQERQKRDILFWPRAREIGLDAFFELGGRQIVDEETKSRILKSGGDDGELDADRQWIKETGTFPPSGNRVAAQLLGFKLRFYASDARDKDDVLPSNLIYLAALLIKIGFLSLRDIYPHIWPTDEDMPAQMEKKKAELAEKEKLNRPGGGASNALTAAGALSDDTLPNNGRGREVAAAKPDPVAKPAADVQDEDKLGEPTDQKVQLLTCLLTIGAIPESLFILGRFPTLPEAYPELLDLVNRILNHSIKDVYAASQPRATQDTECPTKKISDPDQNGVPKGQVRLIQMATRKQLRWPFPDKYDTNENQNYRFYWDEWADNVPVCQNVDDIFILCDTLLNISGVSIGKDAQLLSRLARIGTKSLVEDRSQSNLDRWQDLLKRLLVPALSLNKANTEVVNEIYNMLKFYPVSTRYAIYADWFEGRATPQLPAMKIAFERARLETLSTMKRISGINAQTMARTLSKTATACPGIVFKVALTQIESYNNLTKVVVECAKYFSDLGYDVLVWSLMNALGGHKRSRNNAEFALLPSRWLLALSKFTGEVFKRYRIMDLSPIIQYVNDQLYRGNSTDLVILKELISEMAGIVPDTDFSDKELLAMSGGAVLRKQTLIGLKDRRFESIKTGDRLMRALVETNLAGELLISIAQFRQSAIYRISDEDAHIKMLATMIDDTQSTLSQYLDLLRSNLAIEDFDKHVPGIPELIADFGLAPALAFMIGRASLAHRISKVAPPAPNGTVKGLPASAGSAPVNVDADGDVGMDGGNSAVQANGEESASPSAVLNGSTEGKEDTPMTDLKSQSPPPTPLSTDPFEEILEPIITGVQNALPKDAFKYISADFYVTFWTATLGDLSIPSSSYDAEISRLLAEQSLVMKDRTDMTRAGMSIKENNKKLISQTREALMAEFGKFVGGFGRTKARLLRHKSDWFKPFKAEDVSDAILEQCLIPRILLSPSDADFCFKMIKFLHDNGVPHFRLLSFYGHLFRSNRLRSIIFTCTIREAENLGRFLRLVLADLDRWHNNATVYEKEAWGASANLPGFAKSLDEEGKAKKLVSYDGDKGFKWFHFTWHQRMYNALRNCLEGVEWMHIRNAITILKSVVEVYPSIDFMGNQFIKQLEIVAKREKGVREDLSLTGNAVLVQLKKRSNSWMMVQAFGHNTVSLLAGGEASWLMNT
jgi:THO complex subunit 2